jgi:hypothetical protein
MTRVGRGRRCHCSLALLVAAMFLMSPALDAVADDSIRCRSNKLVNVGMVADQVIALCGEPKSRTAEDVPVRARTQTGNVVVTGSTRLERWTYERGYGQFDALLQFEDGKLIRIDLLTK